MWSQSYDKASLDNLILQRYVSKNVPQLLVWPTFLADFEAKINHPTKISAYGRH